MSTLFATGFPADKSKGSLVKKESIQNKRYRHNNPAARLAHSRINRAIRDGKITRQPCEVCGNPRTHAHHDDYSKPLDVRWLCPKCHGIHHRKGQKQKRKGKGGTPEYHRKWRAARRAANPLPPSPPTKRQLLSSSAVELHKLGMSFQEIGNQLGVSKSTAFKWIKKPGYG